MNNATSRVLSAGELRSFQQDPLLRSTGVLRAPFYRATIVTEADADRSFYETVNEKLLAEGDGSRSVRRGIMDALFLNAHELHTIHRFVGPLRRLGVPTVALVDLDVVRMNDSDWDNLLTVCQVDASKRVRIDAKRIAVKNMFNALHRPAGATKHPIKIGGVRLLGVSDRRKVRALIKELASYGLFIVPTGELESWLVGIGNSSPSKVRWIIDILSKIDEVDPTSNDVWKFIDEIALWINDPKKLGMR